MKKVILLSGILFRAIVHETVSRLARVYMRFSLRLLAAHFILGAAVFAQAPLQYFQVDHIKTVCGEITDIKTERTYHKNDFIVIYLKVKEKTGAELYRVEVSPKWFFTMEIIKGSKIEVKGSYCSIDGQRVMMTQSIVFQGKTYEFRDKFGFPLWKGKGKYMKPGDGAQGRRKRRGLH